VTSSPDDDDDDDDDDDGSGEVMSVVAAAAEIVCLGKLTISDKVVKNNKMAKPKRLENDMSVF
jgi:hypothetical protein